MFLTANLRLLAACTVTALATCYVHSATPDAKTQEKAPAAAPATAGAKDSDVLAEGKGFKITRKQLKDEMAPALNAAASRGQAISAEQEAMYAQQVMSGLITSQLLAAKATDADKAKGKADAEVRLSQIRTNAGSAEEFARQLKAAGLDETDLRQRLVKDMTGEAVVERELDLKVSDAAVKDYYNNIASNSPAKLETPDMVRASHILLSTRDMATGSELSETNKAAKKKLAEDLVKRARAGEDFAKLAKEYSEDPGSKDKGGEYTFPKGQMVPEFEAKAFSMKTNEVSDVVETQFGYHVIKLSEKIPARTMEFAKVETEIRNMLKSQAAQKKLPDYLEKLRKDADVKILDEKLKPKAMDESAGAAKENAPSVPQSEK